MGRSSSAAKRTPPLSDLDLRILDLLSHHRVLTQNQLAAINPEDAGEDAPLPLRPTCRERTRRP